MWATYAQQNQALAAATQIVPADLLSGLEAAGVGIVGGTVIRTHMSVNVRTLDTDTAPSLFIGTIMYDKNAVAAGRPNVANQFYEDWLINHYLTPGTAANAAADPVNAPTGLIWGRQYDLKARRRIHQMSDSYFLCLSNFGTAQLVWSFQIRTLVALP